MNKNHIVCRLCGYHHENEGDVYFIKATTHMNPVGAVKTYCVDDAACEARQAEAEAARGWEED